MGRSPTPLRISIEALAATEGNLTPLFRQLLGKDGNVDPQDVADDQKNEDFPYFEALYEVEGDVVTFPLLWLQVAFYGPLRITTNAP